jgi:RsiW-degrading membrane proteinase PrsW (M82 family)
VDIPYQFELTILVLFIVAFTPSLIYLGWIRRAPKMGRVPAWAMIKTFLFGAILGIIFAVILELILIYFYRVSGGRIYDLVGMKGSSLPDWFILACVIAPIAEELVKLAGVRWFRDSIYLRTDGIVLGASVGLGFAATENLIYEYDALAKSLEMFILVAVLRSISSALLHGSATAISGNGVERAKFENRSGPIFTGYIIAVSIHAIFNFFASGGALYEGQYGEWTYLIGFFVVLLLAWGSIYYVRSKIKKES